MKKLVLLLLVITAITAGCKKYPDGPLISFRSAEKRLYGTSKLTTYTVNGVDSLSLYYDSLCLNFRFWYNDVSYHNDCNIEGRRKDGNLCILIWTWDLINSNKILKVTSSGGGLGTGPFGNNKTPEWEILELKWNDIKMQTNYNGKEYYIELKGN